MANPCARVAARRAPQSVRSRQLALGGLIAALAIVASRDVTGAFAALRRQLVGSALWPLAAPPPQVSAVEPGRWLRPLARAAASATPARPASSVAAAAAARGKKRKRKKPFIPTGEATFLTAGDQPLILSPDGLRTARFEFVKGSGLQLKVETAPSFGPEEVSTLVTERDVTDRIGVVPQEKLGIMGLRDLFWLTSRCFLFTGFEGPARNLAWIADIAEEKSFLVSVPSAEANTFVPLKIDGTPTVRLDAQGLPEILIGFSNVGEKQERIWCWYSVADRSLVDASVGTGSNVSTALWREAVVSPTTGKVEAVLLVNGTIQRHTPDGWINLGIINRAESAGLPGALAGAQTVMPQEYLVGLGPDSSVFVIDTLAPGARAPRETPSAADLAIAEGSAAPPKGAADLAAWVLEQSVRRQTAGLVRFVADGTAPESLFAHPFADISASNVWVDPETGRLEAVVVEDVEPRLFVLGASRPPVASGDSGNSLKSLMLGAEAPAAAAASEQSPGEGATIEALLRSLREKVPPEVVLGGAKLSGSSLEPLLVERHSNRWLVTFRHPLLSEGIVLPALVQDGAVLWVGADALPAKGGARNSETLDRQPRVEGHRLQSAGGSGDVTFYLVLPAADPAALVVRLHGGPHLRDSWGADGLDAWFLGRGYGVLKVNYRGSFGFGQQWALSTHSSASASLGGGFLDDVVAALRWTLDVRRVLGDSYAGGGRAPPVAIVGQDFGGFASLQALLHHRDLFACGVAMAPTQALPQWPDSHIPNAAARAKVQALREAEAWAGTADGPDPAGSALAPAQNAEAFRGLPLLVFEYEKDVAEARDGLLHRLAPPGCEPGEWPEALRFVQYAGEARGGGAVRQSLLDQYRRLDAFLYENLAPLADDGAKLLSEPFVDDLPFLSAALLPQTVATPCPTIQTLEVAFEEGLKQKRGANVAAGIPTLTPANIASGSGFSKTKATPGKRGPLPVPATRLAVRGDGTVEVSVVFDEAPTGLHVLLSPVWLHLRAEGAALTLTLPRQPRKGEQIKPYRLPGDRGFVFEIPADPNMGAIENYQAWAVSGQLTVDDILHVLVPEEIAAAPQVLPEELAAAAARAVADAAANAAAEAPAGGGGATETAVIDV